MLCSTKGWRKNIAALNLFPPPRIQSGIGNARKQNLRRAVYVYARRYGNGSQFGEDLVCDFHEFVDSRPQMPSETQPNHVPFIHRQALLQPYQTLAAYNLAFVHQLN